jgi:hypothetical protein
MSAPRLEPRTPSGGGCPGCGRRPSSAETAARLRAELAVRWLVREAGELVARGFCHRCVPPGPYTEVVCGYCGDGPLLAGPLAAAEPADDPAVTGWLAAQGWALLPALTCPPCRRAFHRASPR